MSVGYFVVPHCIALSREYLKAWSGVVSLRVRWFHHTRPSRALHLIESTNLSLMCRPMYTQIVFYSHTLHLHLFAARWHGLELICLEKLKTSSVVPPRGT